MGLSILFRVEKFTAASGVRKIRALASSGVDGAEKFQGGLQALSTSRMRAFPYFASFVCDASAGGGDFDPRDSRKAGACQAGYDDDLHSRQNTERPCGT